jgi:hypothetical protein
MGIDDSILSVILGESLVDDIHLTSYIDEESHPDIREMQEAIRDVPITAASDDNAWQERLLQRIARELGVLVHQIWEHPGAFSTYLRSEDPAEFYAGMPVTNSQSSIQHNTRTTPSIPPQTTPEDSNVFSISSPQFNPTLQQDPATAEHVAEWGIDDGEIGATTKSQTKNKQEPSTTPLPTQEYEYWEQDLDVTMIFRYLKNRFRRGDNKGNTNTATSTRSTTTYNEQDASNRAAVIRQHHPLVARAHARSQARQLGLRAQMRAAGISTPTSPITRHHHQVNRFRRPSSSCASQSTKLSAKRTHTGLGSGSSRHYWDIGGSVGSGSAAVSVGGPAGVGAWGEV